MNILANVARRSLDRMFPGFTQTSSKRNIYTDFGYPEQISHDMLRQLYSRNSIAKAIVKKTISKTWQTNPVLRTQEDTKELNDIEKALDDHLTKIRAWQGVMTADERSMVGRYAGLLLRIGDDLQLDQPVTETQASIESLIEIVPLWESQLQVAASVTDYNAANYGDVTMYEIQRTDDTGQARNVMVHPDRIIVWSDTGDMSCPSVLESVYNDVIDIEKVKGAGGEGFWKNARQAPVLNVDMEAKLDKMAEAMGTTTDKLADNMDEQVRDYQSGFDSMLMLQGIELDSKSVTLPQPLQFFEIPLRCIAAAIEMPVKILIGNVTGERASTEDAREWAQTCMARRANSVVPSIMALVSRLVRYGMLAEGDWHVEWTDLTETTSEERNKKAKIMSDLNKNSPVETVFTAEELREVLDYAPLEETQPYGDDL